SIAPIADLIRSGVVCAVATLGHSAKASAAAIVALACGPMTVFIDSPLRELAEPGAPASPPTSCTRGPVAGHHHAATPAAQPKSRSDTAQFLTTRPACRFATWAEFLNRRM